MTQTQPSSENLHPAPPPVGGRRRRLALHTRILIGLVAGAALGVGASGISSPRLDWVTVNIIDTCGKVFLRLIFMVVVPLVFSALVLGVAGLGDVRKLGRVGIRTLLLTGVFSSIAVAIGITLVNVLAPGASVQPDQRQALREHYSEGAAELVMRSKQAKPLRTTLLDIIPENPLQEMVGAVDGSSKGNGMLAVMFFALAVGAALTTLTAERREAIVGLLEPVFEVCMVIIAFAMRLAPYAVACLVFTVAARLGHDILRILMWFIITAFVGFAIHFAVVYSAAIRLLGGMSPVAFFRRISEVIVTAFGTSSSNATLPTALRVATDRLALPRDISHFVLTIGATGNQNGTALYEGVVVLFLAQLFGVELTMPQQLTVMLMSVLAGIGTAGVPGGSLPLIVIVLRSVGVPGESIGIILGVDRILDMCRTVLNVAGDMAIATCISHGESRRQALT